MLNLNDTSCFAIPSRLSNKIYRKNNTPSLPQHTPIKKDWKNAKRVLFLLPNPKANISRGNILFFRLDTNGLYFYFHYRT